MGKNLDRGEQDNPLAPCAVRWGSLLVLSWPQASLGPLHPAGSLLGPAFECSQVRGSCTQGGLKGCGIWTQQSAFSSARRLASSPNCAGAPPVSQIAGCERPQSRPRSVDQKAGLRSGR